MTEDKDCDRVKRDMQKAGPGGIIIACKEHGLKCPAFDSQVEYKDLARAENCIVYDDEEGFYTQATVERIARALKEERRRLLNDPRLTTIHQFVKAYWLLSPKGMGKELAEEAFLGFGSLLKENEEGK